MAGCAGLPRDQHGTLERVRGGRVRVGLVEHPPWVVRTSGEPAGAEVELVRRFARELGATPEWHWGGEQQHMEALEQFKLDLVVGGLTKETTWSKYVGLTGPYFEERILVGFPLASAPPSELKGVQVAVRSGESTAVYLERKGAVAVPVDDIRRATGPVAAPLWQLEQLGLKPTEFELHTEKHVMAVAPGENGWLKQLESFLHAQRSQVKGLLEQEAARP